MWEESEEENNKKVMIILNRNKWKLFVIDELRCATEQLAQQASAREAQEELKFVQTKAEKWRAKYLRLNYTARLLSCHEHPTCWNE